MFPLGTLHTTPHSGQQPQTVEVIDPGLHNFGAGPDFFNAKVRVGGQLWVGNVEIHLRSSDWYRHHHEDDPAYNNVILHVVGMKDCEVTAPTPLGRPDRGEETTGHNEETTGHNEELTGGDFGKEGSRILPTLELPVPPEVEANYRELLAEEAYPPCYRVIPQLPKLVVHSWMSALTVERLETKTERIMGWLERTTNDWEQTFFIILARAFGFGTNADTFERWAAGINPQHICKHRDHLEQVEAFFLGTAGLIDPPPALPVREGADTATVANTAAATAGSTSGQPTPFPRREGLGIEREWRFLQAKFRLTPLPRSAWKMGRLRPQNFPQVRLRQLAELYHSRRLDFSRVRSAQNVDDLRALLQARTPEYALSDASIDLLIVNAVAPILFAYGRTHHNETMTERAFALLESIKPERNFITRSWAKAGITSQHAADSQALIELRTRYCDRKDCLRCRFGAAYLKKA